MSTVLHIYGHELLLLSIQAMNSAFVAIEVIAIVGNFSPPSGLVAEVACQE